MKCLPAYPIALSLLAFLGLSSPAAAQSRGDRQDRLNGPSQVPPSTPAPVEVTRGVMPGGHISGGPRRDPGRPLHTEPRPDPTRPKHIPANRPRVFVPHRHRPICIVRPTPDYWRSRDIFADIQYMARRGYIRVIPVDGEVTELTGYSEFPAGWKAYGFIVAPKGKLHVRLHHLNEGWFRLAMCDKWGGLEAGMLQNLIPTGNPEVTFSNPTDQFKVVYVLVDDPGLMSLPEKPYTLNIERSWDPKLKPPVATTVVQGIWARTEDFSAENPGKKG